MLTRTLRRSRRWVNPRRMLALVFLLALASWIGANAYLGRLSSIPTPFVPELPDTDSIQRLLVVAPHCDDEVLAAGGLIREVLARGGRAAPRRHKSPRFAGAVLAQRKTTPVDPPAPAHFQRETHTTNRINPLTTVFPVL